MKTTQIKVIATGMLSDKQNTKIEKVYNLRHPDDTTIAELRRYAIRKAHNDWQFQGMNLFNAKLRYHSRIVEVVL